MKSHSISVWAGISSAGIFGPFFFPATVPAASFLKMLEEEILPSIHAGYDIRELWYQQDGAPAHFSGIVRDFLDENFQNQWIGRGGPVAWPPRSPDLTPPDYFLWGFIKNETFAQNPKTLAELKTAIIAAFQMVTPDMCKRVCQGLPSRLERCLESDGAQIQ